MNAWLIQIKREFWEHQTLFILIPLVIALMVITAGTYVAAFHSSLESRAGMALFGHAYSLETDAGAAKSMDSSGEGDATEYIIDFKKGELVSAEDSAAEVSQPDSRQQYVNEALYGFHSFIMIITGFVLMFYQLNCLYGDRKDRSVLFWKSMPVSESRNVATKILVSFLVVPLLATVISWGIQISYLLLSSLFVYRVGFHPGEVVWAQLDLLHVFSEELKLFLWSMAWWLPLNSWLLLSSALAKRSPFLVATIPFVVIIIMDNLLFGNWHIGRLLLTHLQAIEIQKDYLYGSEINTDINMGSVNLFLDNSTMLIGFLITGLLFPATVWLRNHRFEI